MYGICFAINIFSIPNTYISGFIKFNISTVLSNIR
jgi:hypothetical protein